MDNDLRGLERAFETALRRLDTGGREETLIPHDMVKNARLVRETYVVDDAPTETLSTVSDAVELASTVTSVLGVLNVSDVGRREHEVIRELYRFITGPVREALHRADEQTENPPDKVLLSRIQRQHFTLEERLVHCGTLSEGLQRREA